LGNLELSMYAGIISKTLMPKAWAFLICIQGIQVPPIRIRYTVPRFFILIILISYKGLIALIWRIKYGLKITQNIEFALKNGVQKPFK